MKRYISAILGLTAAALPASALAFTSALTPAQSLTYVENTYITSTGGNHLALCHAVEIQTFLGMGVWISSDEYVVSETGCNGQSARANAGLVNVAFASGALNGTPREPVLTMRQRVEGHAWWGVLGLLLVGGLGWRMMRRGPAALSEDANSRRSERRESLEIEDEEVFRFVDVMLHAAKVDGDPSAEQVGYVREKAMELSGNDYTDDHIEWAICLADKLEDAREFEQFGKDLDPTQARVMLRTALAVLAADGDMTIQERSFMKQLSIGLGLTEADARYLLQNPSAIAAQ